MSVITRSILLFLMVHGMTALGLARNDLGTMDLKTFLDLVSPSEGTVNLPDVLDPSLAEDLVVDVVISERSIDLSMDKLLFASVGQVARFDFIFPP